MGEEISPGHSKEMMKIAIKLKYIFQPYAYQLQVRCVTSQVNCLL